MNNIYSLMRKWNDSRLEKKNKTKDMFSVRITIFFPQVFKLDERCFHLKLQ